MTPTWMKLEDYLRGTWQIGDMILKKRMLTNPMNEKAQHITSEALAKDRALNLDGVVFEFFLTLWDIIGRKYT